MMLRLKLGYVRASKQLGIQCIIARFSLSYFSGTCAMKSRTEGGVVDKDLNVHGIQNLKIAGIFKSFLANVRPFNLSGKCRLKYL